MINATITTRETTEEIAGKRLRHVTALAQRLGHTLPRKLYRENGIWVGVFRRQDASQAA